MKESRIGNNSKNENSLKQRDDGVSKIRIPSKFPFVVRSAYFHWDRSYRNYVEFFIPALSDRCQGFSSLATFRNSLNKLEGKYSLESTDPRESEIRAPPEPLPYLMPIPPTRFLNNK